MHESDRTSKLVHSSSARSASSGGLWSAACTFAFSSSSRTCELSANHFQFGGCLGQREKSCRQLCWITIGRTERTLVPQLSSAGLPNWVWLRFDQFRDSYDSKAPLSFANSHPEHFLLVWEFQYFFSHFLMLEYQMSPFDYARTCFCCGSPKCSRFRSCKASVAIAVILCVCGSMFSMTCYNRLCLNLFHL